MKKYCKTIILLLWCLKIISYSWKFWGKYTKIKQSNSFDLIFLMARTEKRDKHIDGCVKNNVEWSVIKIHNLSEISYHLRLKIYEWHKTEFIKSPWHYSV